MESREKGSVRARSICHDVTMVMAKTPDLKKTMAKIPDLRTLMAKRNRQLAAAALAVVIVVIFARGLWWSDKTDARAQGVPQGRNSPDQIPRIAQVLADLRGVSLETVCLATHANVCSVLAIETV